MVLVLGRGEGRLFMSVNAVVMLSCRVLYFCPVHQGEVQSHCTGP
jgi:hypothetical protein